MIATWNSGSAQLLVSSSAAAPIIRFGTPPTRSKNGHPTFVLRCIVCGRHGRFVDPFPPIPRL
jgi:hypothetical protein